MKKIKVGDKLMGYNPDGEGFELGTVKSCTRIAHVLDDEFEVVTFELLNNDGVLLTNKDLQSINFIIVNDAYKKRHGLLTSEEIIAIRKNRGWTQEDLAKALSFGLKDIARYENGKIQTKPHDKLIRAIGDDVVFETFKKYLELDQVQSKKSKQKQKQFKAQLVRM